MFVLCAHRIRKQFLLLLKPARTFLFRILDWKVLWHRSSCGVIFAELCSFSCNHNLLSQTNRVSQSSIKRKNVEHKRKHDSLPCLGDVYAQSQLQTLRESIPTNLLFLHHHLLRCAFLFATHVHGKKGVGFHKETCKEWKWDTLCGSCLWSCFGIHSQKTYGANLVTPI